MSLPSILVTYSAVELAKNIRDGKISSKDAVLAYLDQFERHNGDVNAIVTPNTKQALVRAENADSALSRGELWGPLHGVPITIKDAFETAGILTTCGHPPLKNHVPKQNATLVDRLIKAGAIILGKTNVPELLTDLQTHNSLFGITNNPWNTDYTSGGSTGGGASALASCMTTLSLGSDIGGSLRVPPSFCGVYGYKATEHLFPSTGHIPEAPGQIRATHYLGSFGLLSRSIRDFRLLLPILAGPDNIDPDVVHHVDVKPTVPLKKECKDYRIAWTDTFGPYSPDKEIKKSLETFIGTLKENGFECKKNFPQHFDLNSIWETWGNLMISQVGANVPSFLLFLLRIVGAGYGRQSPVLKPFMKSTKIKKYMKSVELRGKFIQQWEKFMEDYDVFICPVTMTLPFKHLKPTIKFGGLPIYLKKLEVNGEMVNYFTATQLYTTPFNVLGTPVVTFPIGFSKNRLPIGVQIVGKRFQDADLLVLAENIEKIIGNLKLPFF